MRRSALVSVALMGLLSAGCASRNSLTPEEQLRLLQHYSTPDQQLQYRRDTDHRVRALASIGNLRFPSFIRDRLSFPGRSRGS